MPDDNADHKPGFDAAGAAAEFAAALANEPPAADARNYTAILEDEVETLGSLVAEKDAELQAARDDVTAARAEIDTVRARIERDAAGTSERKRRKLLVSFLEVADDLDLAVRDLSTGGPTPQHAQGVRLVRDKLNAVLTQHGAQRRPSLGLPFDPAHHEAIATVPATADRPAGTVADVISEGYALGEHTLRAARVVVAKGA